MHNFEIKFEIYSISIQTTLQYSINSLLKILAKRKFKCVKHRICHISEKENKCSLKQRLKFNFLSE